MGHNVGKAAENAVNRSNAKSKEERTPEKILSDIRKNLVSGLSVTPLDIKFLLEQHDSWVQSANLRQEVANQLAAELSAAQIRIKHLEAQVEQFRTVYEQENVSGGVTFEAVKEGTDQNPLVNTTTDLGVITPAEIAANEQIARVEAKQIEHSQHHDAARFEGEGGSCGAVTA